VHDVAVVPEAIPVALVDLRFVIVEQEVELVLETGPRRRRAVDERPVAEHPRGPEIAGVLLAVLLGLGLVWLMPVLGVIMGGPVGFAIVVSG
jgi:hypothetical protein